MLRFKITIVRKINRKGLHCFLALYNVTLPIPKPSAVTTKLGLKHATVTGIAPDKCARTNALNTLQHSTAGYRAKLCYAHTRKIGPAIFVVLCMLA